MQIRILVRKLAVRAAVLLLVLSSLAFVPSVEAAAAAGAAESTVSVFPNTIDGPSGIARGPDGALWFANSNGQGSIGRIATTGEITTFTDEAIRGPVAITAGPDGALWFTNQGNDSIGRITTSGDVTAFTDSSISGPRAITAGPDGALWYANQFGNSIGRITTTGVVTSFTDPGIIYPGAITAGPDGALWFANGFGENSIGRITTNGVVTKFAGPGIASPQGITAGPDGALWFTNGFPSSIGRITTSGTITTFANSTVNNPTGIVTGPDGALWFTNGSGGNSVGRITTAGAIANFADPTINAPLAITSGPDGALWFTNQNGSSIGRITTGGAITDIPGSKIDKPYAITAGPDGALWFTNHAGDSIGRITTSGAITRFTGPGISRPTGISTGPDGALWFTNQVNSSIGRITTAGTVKNFTGPGINVATDIASGPDGALWFTNQGNNSIGRITTLGSVTNYRGGGIDVPVDITAGPDGALWFTNRGGDSIGRISLKGKITTFKGAGISRPRGIAPGPDGALWFTNAGNSSIGRITTSGRVSNLRGRGIDMPAGIVKATSGSLWFTNKGNGSIGRITTSGRVSNYTSSAVHGPIGITSGPDGALWFTNFATDSIGRISGDGGASSRPRATPAAQIIDAAPDADLSCTTSSTRSDWLQHFSATNFLTARSCATVVSVPGYGVFGPPSFTDDGSTIGGTPLIPYEAVSQDTVAPSAANGYTLRVETIVRLPGTGLSLRQRDTYVSGRDDVLTSVRVVNNGTGPRDVVVYRTGDCFPGSDLGFGISRDHSVGCEQAVQDGLNAVPVAGPLYMRWDPVSGRSRFEVGAVADVRAAIAAGAPLADRCDCSEAKDIAAAVSWTLHLSPGAGETVAHRLTYSVGSGRERTSLLAGAAENGGVHRFTAHLRSNLTALAGASVDFVVGSITACTAVTNREGTASCDAGGPVPGFVVRYRGDTTYQPAAATYSPKHPPPAPADPAGFPACGHFDRAGVALVTGGDSHSATVFSTTEAPPCPVVQYTVYGDGVEIGEMRGDLRATDLSGSPVPGMAVLFVDEPFGTVADSCMYLTATDTRTGELLDVIPGPSDNTPPCLGEVGGQKYR